MIHACPFILNYLSKLAFSLEKKVFMVPEEVIVLTVLSNFLF